MNVKMQHFLRTTSVLLVLTVLLLGQMPPATALEAHQEPPDRVVQGYGDFPRLPVVAPGADGTTIALYLVEGDRATQLLQFEGLRIGHALVIMRPSRVLDTPPPICGTMNVRDKDPHRSHAVRGFLFRYKCKEVER